MAVNRSVPTQEQLDDLLIRRNNWGRWGAGDQRGAINLITPQKRVEAARLVKSGRVVSLSREVETAPQPGGNAPKERFLKYQDMEGCGFASDFIGILPHGLVNTHVDALCHMWGGKGLFNARDPKEAFRSFGHDGVAFGAIDAWGDGIVTRGVLADIPRLRGLPFADEDHPIHGWDLEDAVKAQGVTMQPGDALCVYGGRDAFRAHRKANPLPKGGPARSPGLHASCLEFLRDNDVSVLAWDLMDYQPSSYRVAIPVHGAIFAYGIALVDNALLWPLAEACAQERRWEFMFSIAPLKLAGGTGSPVNPLAIF